jgi:hypothetical protein
MTVSTIDADSRDWVMSEMNDRSTFSQGSTETEICDGRLPIAKWKTDQVRIPEMAAGKRHQDRRENIRRDSLDQLQDASMRPHTPDLGGAICASGNLLHVPVGNEDDLDFMHLWQFGCEQFAEQGQVAIFRYWVIVGSVADP